MKNGLGEKRNVSHLRVFGSLAYFKNIIGHLKNLDGRIVSIIFIGYEMGSKAYRCSDPNTLKVHVYGDVIFEENISFKWNEMKESPLKQVFFINT